MILTLIDTTGIQGYIFGSNRLQENIGASYLADQATEAWAREAFSAVQTGADRILYTGGGNAVMLFAEQERAERFERLLSRRVLTDAPGLLLLAVHQEQQETLPRELDRAFARMALLKAERDRSAPLLGLSVTRNCRSTGLPAMATLPARGANAAPLAVAPEIYAKVQGFNAPGKTADLAHDRLVKSLHIKEIGMHDLSLQFPRDFEDLGATKGEQSYIAVVHADGNGMGERIRKIGEAHREDDTGYEQAIQEFSDNVKQASIAALQQTLLELINVVRAVHNEPDKREIRSPYREGLHAEIAISLRRDGGRWRLPFRPIVFGGDDVTFVCDGRLGLTLAAAYLRHFREQTAVRGIPLTACAGVAIVKSHYPFARAYALSEQLCASAKRYRKELIAGRDLQAHPEQDLSALDWHFALSGLMGDLGEIREREYRVRLDGRAGDLHLRPVTLEANPDRKERSWEFVEETTLAFQDEEWHSKRNKMKALREVLREGPAKVKEFKSLFRQDAPLLEGDGWNGDRCRLYDSIELADIHVPFRLRGETTQSGGDQ